MTGDCVRKLWLDTEDKIIWNLISYIKGFLNLKMYSKLFLTPRHSWFQHQFKKLWPKQTETCHWSTLGVPFKNKRSVSVCKNIFLIFFSNLLTHYVIDKSSTSDVAWLPIHSKKQGSKKDRGIGFVWVCECVCVWGVEGWSKFEKEVIR